MGFKTLITPDVNWDPLQTLNDLSAIVQAQSQLLVDLTIEIGQIKKELEELKANVQDTE